MNDFQRADWHLDKKVTLPIIFALLFNAGSMLWWASRLDQTVSQHGVEIQVNRRMIEESRSTFLIVNDRTSRMEVSQEYIVDSVKEIRQDIKTIKDKKN